MDPVVTECEACMGNRYNEEAMGCLYQGKNMVGLLALTASEAMEVFGDSPKILRHRKVMEQVGLSYLALGQPLSTLSDGERQRIKQAKDAYGRQPAGVLRPVTDGMVSAWPEREVFMNAIEVKDLRKSFHGKKRQEPVEAVKGISLTVKQGEIFGFLGPNGAGKTTSLRMLTTLLPIDGGEARIGSYDVKRNPARVRRHIGYVGQLGGADLEATGRENLMLSGRLYGMRKDEVKQQSEQIMDLLELRDVMDRQAKTYSGGQRRRLEIGLGILHKPDVLFLDEPTAGLDPHNRANLWKHIRKLREGGMTVFLTTHYLEEADELCDRLCIMDRGVIVAEGTPQALKREISGDVVSIRLKGYLNDAARLLGGIHDVLDIRTEGENISLYVKDGAAALPEICNVLRENGEEAETLSLSQPSLDDVFLKQTGRSLRDTKRGGITI